MVKKIQRKKKRIRELGRQQVPKHITSAAYILNRPEQKAGMINASYLIIHCFSKAKDLLNSVVPEVMDNLNITYQYQPNR
jgi:hypothetical protein